MQIRRWLSMVIFLVVLVTLTRSARPPVVSRRVRYLLFPPNSNMGIEAALSLPVRQSVNVAMNIEANYLLPDNITQFYPEFQSGSLWTDGVARLGSGFGLTRARTYATIENFMNKIGMDGHTCLLRAICECSESSLRHNGLFGDLLHILFSPSTSTKEDLSKEFEAAEFLGRDGGDCTANYASCRTSIFDLFSAFAD